MTANNTKNKSTAKRKLVPAVGMLLASAMALSSSTYAWFTMSREVEVTGIKMTATVPEDFQISLGKLAVTGTPATAVTESNFTTYSLANSTGVLYAESGSVAGDSNATTPSNNAWDWSNSADISAYYDFGRLIPASSTSGQQIYYTPDAAGVGKTVKGNASYYMAADLLNAKKTGDNTQEAPNTDYTLSSRATLHAYTSAADKTDPASGDKTSWKTKASGGYTQAADWKKTNDDGYYVDIPVWIRTSSNAPVGLSVDGYVLPGSLNATAANNKQTDLELYRAVRVAILNGATTTASDAGEVATSIGTACVTGTGKGNIIPLKDAWNTELNGTGTTGTAVSDATTEVYTKIWTKANPFAAANTSILDSDNMDTAVGETTRGAGLISGWAATDLGGVSEASKTATDPDGDTISDTYAGTYAKYTALVPTFNTAGGTPDTVATIEGSTASGNYGTPKKLIIRVWLDGEDGECWNDNAGQDWAISLKFSKIESNS